MKKIFTSLLLAAASLTAYAQEYGGLWHAAPADYAATHGKPALQPLHYTTITADEAALSSVLTGIPQGYAKARTIVLPMPDGGYRAFRIWATPVMEDALAAKYPGITTYTGEALDNTRVTAKIDYSPFGLHAMVYDGANTCLIDPYSGTACGGYIAYYRHDYSRPADEQMVCAVGEDERLHGAALSAGSGLPDLQRLNGATRKKYRLALAADSEYCIAVAGANPTKAAVLAKMVVSVNRVNGVYEREFAVTMMLIANDDVLIFNTTAPDPYSNNNGSAMQGENQTTITTLIGSLNYDIGHVFSTTFGGIATQGCVCDDGNKARGVTGKASPVGDAFDIDFVAHEMGHQFGAGHTFNANTGSCAGNGVANIAYEPGSGSTIMAYAGICGSGNDFQAHSDAYFHSASLEEISDYITLPNAGGSCPAVTTSTNTNAVVPPFSATYQIPYRTPFELTAPQATDATADTLTYCWEERDLGDFTQSLANTHLSGPLFRSFRPTTSRTRVFPTINSIVMGVTSAGEKLPDVARNMVFRLTERDIYQGWGTFAFPDDAITIGVTQTPDTFMVTAPVAFDTWVGGGTQTVKWDVVNTTAAPISCARVDIFMSVDGGYTYPYLVVAGTPNDGSEAIKVPNPPVMTINARIKVKGAGNVFFNINNGDFTVEHGTVGVAPAPIADGIIISPLPAAAELRVQIPVAAGTLAMSLINPLGQAVWSGSGKGSTAVPAGNLPRGVYYMQLSGAGVQATRRVVLR